MKKTICIAAFVFAFISIAGSAFGATGEIVLENPDFRLVIGNDAIIKSLIHKPSGEECLEPGIIVPAFAITQYRPYDNELQLSFPAKTRTFPAKSVRRDGDTLVVEFKLISHIATIEVAVRDGYIGFALQKLDYLIEDYGVKRVTPVDEFILLQLPVRKRENFGEWLNVMWDEDIAVNLLATGPAARIDAFPGPNHQLLNAAAVREVRLLGTGCALIVASKDSFLDRVRQLEEDYGLPEGVRSRRRDEYKWSYYELRGEGNLLQTIDRNIEYAKQGGFRAMVVYYPDFARAAGHFEWREELPNGMDDLQSITKKIKAAGMIPGLHMHYNKAGTKDPYVSPIPDHRLNLRTIFTLAESLDAESGTITVEEDPSGSTMDDRRRYLKIGREIISYQGFSSSRPYRFTGCIRGALGTTPESYDTGHKFGLLDVDTWPDFVRFDQRTSIQEEVAERISRICAEAGFEFLYFDGAEDIHPPYWFHGANAQYKVYQKLSPKPLFSEGAMKSHFSWHILTRGNAFDHFPPEVIKEATRRYPLAEAAHISKDFTALNFGWMSYVAPGEETIGSQPDMYEYVTSHAAGWDCPVSLVARLDQMDRHPRTPDNLEVLKRWEDVRNTRYLEESMKLSLRDPAKEHILLIDEEGDFELREYHHLVRAGGGDPSLRAFIFERTGTPWVVYWHSSGEGRLALPLPPDKIELYEKGWEAVAVEDHEKGSMLPLGSQRYIRFGMPAEKAKAAMENSSVLAVQ